MDASNQPEKASEGAASAQGRDGTADTPRVDSPSIVPDQGEPEQINLSAGCTDAPTVLSGTSLIIAPLDARREHTESKSAPRAAPWRLTKLTTLAASLALAVGVGTIAGAIGTLGLQRALTPETGAHEKTLQESIVRLSSEFAAFKATAEATAKATTGQVTRLTDRVDRAERAQADPAARLARLSDAVAGLEKRVAAAPVPPASIPATSPVAAPRTAPPDVTGSIAPAAPAGAKDLARLPIMPGWVLHSVQGGAAIVQSRMGIMEIEVGDPLPGGGRVEAIRRDGGRWVVVTSRGLILAR